MDGLFERDYRISEGDDVLAKENAIHRSLDLRLVAVEALGRAFAEGNRVDVDLLLKAIDETLATRAAAFDELLGSAIRSIAPAVIATTPVARFTSDAEIGDLADDAIDGDAATLAAAIDHAEQVRAAILLVIALASQADAAAGTATTGLMTPDLTRRHVAASILAAGAGSIGGALLAKLDKDDASGGLVKQRGAPIALPLDVPLSDRVDPRSFGAKFDGVLHPENGPALQAWIDFIKGTEKVGFLPPGQCLFDTALVSTLSLHIEGAGLDVTKLVYTGTGSALRLAATALGTSGNLVPRLANFSIYCTGTVTAGNPTLSIVNFPGARAANVGLYGGWRGLQVGPGAFAARLDQVLVKGTAEKGIAFANDLSANNSRVTGGFVYDAGSWAIDIPNGDGASVLGTALEGNRGGIRVGAATALTIDGNYIEASSNTFGDGGIHFAAANYGTRITNNWLGAYASNNWTDAIGVTITGNTFYNYAPFLAPSSIDATVGTNRFLGVSSLNEASYAALAFKNGWSAGVQAPGFKRDNTGTVRMRGSIQGGASGSVPCTLPAGYRPSDVRVFSAVDGNGTPTRLLVYTNGDVLVLGGVSNGVTLDGVAFQAAQ